MPRSVRIALSSLFVNLCRSVGLCSNHFAIVVKSLLIVLLSLRDSRLSHRVEVVSHATGDLRLGQLSIVYYNIPICLDKVCWDRVGTYVSE